MQVFAQQLRAIEQLQGHNPSIVPPTRLAELQGPSQGCGVASKKKGKSNRIAKPCGLVKAECDHLKTQKCKKPPTQQKEVLSAAPALPFPPGPVLGRGEWSRGSKNHNLGQCRPCKAFNTQQGCAEGAACNFCHCAHTSQKLEESKAYSAKASERRSTKQEGEDLCACTRQPRAANVQALVSNTAWCAPVPSSFHLTPPGLDAPFIFSC